MQGGSGGWTAVDLLVERGVELPILACESGCALM